MMDFPTIFDFDEADTVPSELLELNERQVRDVKSGPIEKVTQASPEVIICQHYPRIMQQIELLWGSQELQDRFASWIIADQDGRKGWPVPVYGALLELSNLHATLHKLEGNPVWGQIPDRW